MKLLGILALCLLSFHYSNAAQTCTGAFDVVFVVEDTDHLAAGDQATVATFLNDIALRLIYSKDTGAAAGSFSQLAYQQYNSDSKTVFDLNQYKTGSDIRSGILLAPFNGATVDNAPINLALDYTYNNVLPVGNGERACQPVVVILVSFSSFADPNSNNARYYQPKYLEEQQALTSARTLIHSGALLLTVGVGSGRNPQLLLALTNGDPTAYFDVDDVSKLDDTLAGKIVDRFCNPAYVPPQSFYPLEVEVALADIVFVVDVSTKSSANLPNIITFIKNFLTPFTYGENGVQAAVVPYSATAIPGGYLNDFSVLQDFLNKAGTDLGATQGTDRNIASALDYVNNQVLIANRGYRASVAQQVYVITSDCFTGDEPQAYADAIRAKGAQIYVIRLDANFGFWKESLTVAGTASNVFQVFTPGQSSSPNDISDVLTTFLPTQGWTTLSEDPKVVPPALPPASGTGQKA